MIAPIALFLFALFATVLSAPAALDRDTLLNNAQNAQALNARFQNMSRTDKCNGEFGRDPSYSRADHRLLVRWGVCVYRRPACCLYQLRVGVNAMSRKPQMLCTSINPKSGNG